MVNSSEGTNEKGKKTIKHGVSSYKVGVNLVSVALVVCERGQRTRELAISTPVCW